MRLTLRRAAGPFPNGAAAASSSPPAATIRLAAPGALVLCAGAIATAPLAAPVAAQRLGDALRRTPAPLVQFSFPARPNVCGAGAAILIREPDGGVTFVNHDGKGRGGWRDGEPPCETGDVVIRVERDRDRGIVSAAVRVGSRADAAADPVSGLAVDLGAFQGQEAADALLELAASAPRRSAGQLIFAAGLADAATTWPALLRLARDRTLASGTRRDALFWLARQVEEHVADAIGGIARDRTEADEVRAAAVFALSQLPEEQAVPRLLDLGRSSTDPLVRGKALFWLAQFDDPRVTDAFEEILAGGGNP